MNSKLHSLYRPSSTAKDSDIRR